ncbi:MAG: hypothetical protein IPM29_23040 [Planctomycetes bacterium]|nr:hypothetical protein [Planctomycetota bacterium]
MSRLPAALAILTLLAIAPCCESSAAVVGTEGGWVGRGSSFQCTPESGPAWGFAVEGAGLVLTRADDRLIVADAVGDDGLRFQFVAMIGPEVDFELAGGSRRIEWRGADVRIDGVDARFGSGPQRVQLPPR